MESLHACLFGESDSTHKNAKLMTSGLLRRNAFRHGFWHHWWCSHHAGVQKVHYSIPIRPITSRSKYFNIASMVWRMLPGSSRPIYRPTSCPLCKQDVSSEPYSHPQLPKMGPKESPPRRSGDSRVGDRNAMRSQRSP